MLVITSLCCEHESSDLKDLNTNKYYGCPFCPNNRESENLSKYSPHSRNEVSIFFENQSRLLHNYQDSCQQGRVGRMVLQQEIVSVDIWNRLTWGALQFLGVYTRTQPIHCSWEFTFGPRLVTVPPPINIRQLYHGQSSAFAVGLYMWTQPSYGIAR